MQRRHSSQLLPRIHIGTRGKQDLYDLGAVGANSEVSVVTHVPISDRLVQSSVPILTAPGNPLAERVHVRTGGEQGFDDFDGAVPDRELQGGISIDPGIRIGAGRNQGFDSAEVPTEGSIDQPAVKDAGVVTETGRSHEHEHKDNGKRLHRVLTPSLDRIVGRPPLDASGHEVRAVRLNQPEQPRLGSRLSPFDASQRGFLGRGAHERRAQSARYATSPENFEGFARATPAGAPCNLLAK